MLLPIILISGLACLFLIYFLSEKLRKVKDGNVSTAELKEFIALANGETAKKEKSEKFAALTEKYALLPIVNATVERVGNKILSLSGGKNNLAELSERATVYHDKISTSVVEYEGERDDRYFTVYGGERLKSLLDKFAVAKAIGDGLKVFLKDSYFQLFASQDIAVEIKITSCVVTRTDIKERVARINVKVLL